MTLDLEGLTARERRLCEVLAAYYEASAEGRAPQPRTICDENPDLASGLAVFFSEQERLRSAIVPLRPPARPGDEASGSGPGRDRGDEADRTSRDEPAADARRWTALGPFAKGIRRFGDYELLEELAIGGMGVVYKARQVGLNRLVALKVIRSGEFASEADVRRFHAEAETVADLDHPHIVPIYEVGERRGYHFFSMKLVGGGTLRSRIDRYVPDPRGAARVVAALARAVQHAHERGILHRDLKPSNVLLDEKGEPMLVDFGLSKRLDATTDLTAPGAILGTPPYFAPEMATGGKRAITTAADVYGLGAIFYALLTGRVPFRAESIWELIRKVKEQAPEPPRDVNPRVEVEPQTICLKCLEKDPKDRYGSARELAEDLDRWLNGEPIRGRPASWWHRARAWCRQPARRQQAGAHAAVVGVLLMIWACVGSVLIGLGGIRVAAPGAVIAHVCGWIVLPYLPMILIGRLAAKGRAWAVRAGLIHAGILLVVDAIHLLGLYGVGDGPNAATNPASRSLGLTLFYLSTVFVAAGYAVANISLASDRPPAATLMRRAPAMPTSGDEAQALRPG
ncbi:Serine/threonine-protein kinase PrkC [Aquisphaera giovannonii]|uniref:Serine/threonine-protein kinase PrkC n=1 Tax=Aquisphaera giovannonii TaxID=406548 RepID=A0A5B9WEH7_9BACT|nr:serine/threonine-protein kinase [Aquisphaera giovannonii]QEH39058.1 Serine/threonine-protein kinase PrkC [Aquisphaera giovannonii]